MYHEDTEMLFPMRVVPSLADLRGAAWKRLVTRVTSIQEDDPEALAFGLMMVHLDGCLTCQADSYRALRGCTACARQAVMRFRGSDHDLVRQYDRARKDVQAFFSKGGPGGWEKTE
jgi:hypothetical protein